MSENPFREQSDAQAGAVAVLDEVLPTWERRKARLDAMRGLILQ